ncbi:MAG: beta-Ala-His dipeptidase [Schwartzia sp.]|nr:beta-Ala-His dipeptidase [Schwartzia sp. (in: firmicutes)]
MANDNEILESVLAEFEKLAAIPRPSGHEEAVSNYLKEAFAALGCPVTQDAANNIIADLAATPGYEETPRTILQSHMDMVCVAADGIRYDPEKDPIRLVRDSEYLRAEGTSLGSDDGIGVAEILSLFRNPPEPHGPLRAIITTEEETGMGGAIMLDAKHVADAAFYLNCDSEEDDLLTVGSAGGLDVSFSRPVRWQPAVKMPVWRLTVAGLRGGHSGERINDGRGNAIQFLADLLTDFATADIPVFVASLTGGTAINAIPATAEAVILTMEPEKDLRQAMKRRRDRFLAAFGAADPDLTVTIAPTERPSRMMSQADVKAVAGLISVLHSGVFAMSPALPGLVETSANIGLLRTEEDRVWFSYYPRSCVNEKLAAFQRTSAVLGEQFGCPARIGIPSPAWQERPGSRLAKLVTAEFERQRGKKMRVASLHVGLECSFMLKKNPGLDVVSIGATTLDIHSPQERLVLATVAPQVRLIAGTLRRIAEMVKAATELA